MSQEFDVSRELTRALRTVWRGRRTVAAAVAAALVVAVAVSLVLPHGFEARSSFLAVQDGPANFAEQMATAGAAIPAGLLSMPTSPADMFREVLESRAARLGVVRDLDLVRAYGIDTDNEALATELALKRLKKQMRIAQKRSGLLAVEVMVKSPWFPFLHDEKREAARLLAPRIANSTVDQLNRILQERRISSARNSREYLEVQIAQDMKALEVASDSLVAYQKRHETIAIEEQARVTVETLGALRAQIVQKEVELQVLRRNRAAGSNEVALVEDELHALRESYGILMRGGSSDDTTGIHTPVTAMPDVAAELMRRQREVELRAKVNELLTTQYYQAKLEEARDIPTVQLLDRADPPVRKSWPKRRMIVVLAVVGGFLVGAGWVLWRERTPALAAVSPTTAARP